VSDGLRMREAVRAWEAQQEIIQAERSRADAAEDELQRLRLIAADYAELTAWRGPEVPNPHRVSMTAYAEKIAEKRQAIAERDEACREVDRVRGRQGEPTGVMTTPVAGRTEAIRLRYGQHAFSGPTDTERERDQVIGHLLGELDNRDDELVRLRDQVEAMAEAAAAGNVRTLLDLAAEHGDLDAPQARVEKTETMKLLEQLGDVGEEWGYGPDPDRITVPVAQGFRSGTPRQWAESGARGNRTKLWARMAGQWREMEVSGG